MIKKLFIIISGILLHSCHLFSQQVDSVNVATERVYSFNLWDSPSVLSTMRQFNENYLSTYRFVSLKLYEEIGPKWGSRVQILASLVLMPVTHEEGHRSILNSKNIGSISKPYWNLKGAAYLEGVRDSELKNLRDTDLPSYIRLHTAGIESDYFLSLRMKTLSAFEQERPALLKIDWSMRKSGVILYNFISLFKILEPDLKEESDEMKRDIVGHDVYGAIRHLHRPNMNFYRYTRYDSLTSPEKQFVKRVAFRSLLNLLDPMTFRSKPNIQLSENWKGMFGIGYIMCPFGDFIDENIWLRYRNKINTFIYFRQFQNKDNWFPSGGISIVDFPIHKRWMSTASLHIWSQPANLNFNTKKGDLGGAGELLLKYKLINANKTHLRALSIDIGMIYKTYGYLPEEIVMDKHFGLRLGTSVFFK